MSRRRVYSDDTIGIMGRYFLALDCCLERKLIKSVSWYCTTYSIDKRHLYVQRADMMKGYFEVGWLRTLTDNYGVSAVWLLMGKGEMFE